MELIAVTSQELLTKSQWASLEKKYKITFTQLGGVKTLLKSSNEKVLLIDPDFIDWKFPNEVLKNACNLKGVFLTTTTASYVDEEYLQKNNIPLLTIPKYSTDSVAEYLVFLMMCVAKKLPLQIKNGNKQDFDDDFLQMELFGKTAGIVGLGNIGNRVAKIVSGMGMKVVYYNRTQKSSNFKSVSLKQLFKDSDVVFITLANNKQTQKLITDQMLLSMKKSAILISGTGIELHNDAVVRKMLKEKKLFGFGAEIPNLELGEYEGNVMTTSEYAWFTYEATERRKQIILNNLLDF